MKRREFLTSLGLGAAGMVIPAVPSFASNLIPEELKDAVKPASANDKVNVAFIGLGQQAMGLLNSFLKIPGVRVVCGADVYDIKRNRFVERVTKYYQGLGEKKVKVDCYEDYQTILARKDVDAVRAHVDPLVPVETGHTSNIVCCLGNIATELKRPVVWNPIVQKFMNDPEAQKMTAYDYRNGYDLNID